MHPADRLAARVRDSGATPILTFYDLAVPGHDRVELSATSLANAVAKTAGLLRDELDAEPGDLISINLPVHWQLPVWLLACAATGTVAGLQAPPDGARACAAEAEVYAEAESPLRGRAEWDVAVSLHPLGLPPAFGLPDNVVNHALAARAHPDVFVPFGLSVDDPLLVTSTGEHLSVRDASVRAREWAVARDLVPGERWALSDTSSEIDDVALAVLACILDDGSLVLIRHADAGDTGAIADIERARLA